jgi:V/A-type H+-transporting ATPase subunit D
MAKVKLTKNELKKQKDQLKRFRRYLPTLQLKKQQLQMEIRHIEALRDQKRQEQAEFKRSLEAWIAVFGEDWDLSPYVKIAQVRTGEGNIAGVDIPIFQGVDFESFTYDLIQTPFWIDAGVHALKTMITYDIQVEILEEQVRLLSEELRITTQRVNLFEKIKIPETRENIRRINIYLGDQQTAAVVRGKIAKGKLVRAQT